MQSFAKLLFTVLGDTNAFMLDNYFILQNSKKELHPYAFQMVSIWHPPPPPWFEEFSDSPEALSPPTLEGRLPPESTQTFCHSEYPSPPSYPCPPPEFKPENARADLLR
jgi:hypothetical protein